MICVTLSIILATDSFNLNQENETFVNRVLAITADFLTAAIVTVPPWNTVIFNEETPIKTGYSHFAIITTAGFDLPE
jgi:hypothetical protein